MVEYRRDSFIRRTQTRDRLFLDVNRLPAVPSRIDDEEYIIEPMFENRPDLLAYEVYGNARAWWVIVLRNTDVIRDPLRDFRTGVTIQLPNPETVKRLAG
jgi:hypothetical protein